MTVKEHNEDWRKLEKNPQELLMSYQDRIRTIVQMHINWKYFDRVEEEDIIQEINTQLLEKKLAQISKHYNGSSALRTYFSRVVQNMCREMIRKRNRTLVTQRIDDHPIHAESGSKSDFGAYLSEERKRFEAILKTYRPAKRKKLMLCMRLMSYLPITEGDFKTYFGEEILADPDHQKSIEAFMQPYGKLDEKKICEHMVPMFNAYEGKQNSTDSLRKWIDLQYKRLTILLNGDPPRYHYTKDRIKALVQFYQEQK